MKRQQSLLTAVQGLGIVCGCLLALLTALSLTLFREGFYLHELEQSGCLQVIYDNVQQGARTVAEAAGLRGDILEELVTPEQVRVAVIRRADVYWKGSSEQPDSPYADAVAYLEDTITAETGEMWDQDDANLYKNIQLICDDMWRTNAVPPMSNLLNLLMQYRRIAWALMALMAASLIACRRMMGTLCRNPQELWDAVWGLGFGIAVDCALTMAVIALSGWQSWMPDTDPAYGLYLEWMGALGPVIAACGVGLAGLVWATGLKAYGLAHGLCRNPKRVQSKTSHKGAAQ